MSALFHQQQQLPAADPLQRHDQHRIYLGLQNTVQIKDKNISHNLHNNLLKPSRVSVRKFWQKCRVKMMAVKNNSSITVLPHIFAATSRITSKLQNLIGYINYTARPNLFLIKSSPVYFIAQGGESMVSF